MDPDLLRIVFPFAPGEDADPVNAPAMGSNALLDVLTRWAAHDYGAAVTVDDDGCAYLTSDPNAWSSTSTADTPSSGT